MTQRERLSLGACALLVALTALASAAQAQPSDPVAREARSLFDQGIAASDAGRYAEAVTHFERSLQLRASPAVLRNLAVAYRGVGRLLDAQRTFEQYFANPGARVTAEELAQLRADFEALRREIPELTLEVTPADAAVLLDGRALANRGPTLRVDPGRHVFEAQAPEHAPQRLEVELARSERRTLALRLAPLPPDGRVAVESNVPNARIELDGRFVGSQSVNLEVAPGAHAVVVTAQGYQPVRRSVTAGRHGLLRMSIVLERTPGLPPWAVGTIVVGTLAVTAGVATAVGVTLTRGSFVMPSPPAFWGELTVPR